MSRGMVVRIREYRHDPANTTVNHGYGGEATLQAGDVLADSELGRDGWGSSDRAGVMERTRKFEGVIEVEPQVPARKNDDRLPGGGVSIRFSDGGVSHIPNADIRLVSFEEGSA